MFRTRSKAFSLAELLIALLILAEIATFTIPKVLSSQQNARKKAVFKETVAMISEIVHLGTVTGNMQKGADGTYVMGRVNAIKVCPTDSTAELCWTQGGSAHADKAGFVLPNGATVTGFDNVSAACTTTCHNGFAIDWDGTQGNNTLGDDQINLRYAFAGSTYGTTRIIRSGTVGPDDANAPSVTLYDSIFN